MFFFTDPATTEIYTLSLHDALPIFTGTSNNPVRVWARCVNTVAGRTAEVTWQGWANADGVKNQNAVKLGAVRSEEHTSELQSQFHLVCRLLLEKKKKQINHTLNN